MLKQVEERKVFRINKLFSFCLFIYLLTFTLSALAGMFLDFPPSAFEE